MRAPFSLVAATALVTTPVYAQTRIDTFAPAQVSITDTCAKAGDAAMTLRTQESGLPAALATPLLGLAGDIVGAGLNALAGVLEEASRAHGYGAQGLEVFDYYKVSVDPIAERVAASPVIGAVEGAAGGLRCLTIDVKAGQGPTSALYVEAVIARRSDGLEVLPVYFDYREAIAGAPRGRALPAELHIEFAQPGGATGTPAVADPLGGVFAIARTPLPTLRPGDPAKLYTDMLAYRSGVVPARPFTGSAKDGYDTIRAGWSVYWSNKSEKAKVDTVDIKRALEDELQTPPAAGVRRSLQLQRRSEDLGRDIAAFESSPEYGASSDTRLGSTNMRARVVFTREGNRFGAAVAKALSDRSKAIGDGVATALAPQPAWTAGETAYVTAMLAVDAKQAELARATLTGGDPVAIAALAREVRSLQASANGAAVTAGRTTLPFPAARF